MPIRAARPLSLLLLAAFRVAASDARPVLGDLPASYTGDLPCADCAGIRYRLNLFPGQAFYLDTEYLGRGDGRHFYHIGRWSMPDDGGTIVLRGGREAPIHFRITEAGALRKLDLEGRDIESTLNHTLTRTADFERIEPRLSMRGRYRYLADAALFTECLTGQRWPVAEAGDNVALQRAYAEARTEAGQEVLVSVEGQVAMRPPMEGDTLVPTLVVERFVGIWPDADCGAAGGQGKYTARPAVTSLDSRHK